MKNNEKRKILGQKLDPDELDKVSGGMHYVAIHWCKNRGSVGSCTGPFYNEPCRATVESWSKCMRTDFQWTLYTVNQSAKDRFGVVDHPDWCTILLDNCAGSGTDTSHF